MLVPCAKSRWPALFKPVIFLGILLTGCGERPPFPRWPQQTPIASEQVVLSDNLSVTDLRQIARAVNGSGKLQSLQPWMEKISDEQLNALGRILHDFIYQDALSTGSAMDLLEQRIDRKFFSNFANILEVLANSGGTGEMADVVKKLVAHPRFPDLVDLNIHWLDPMWGKIAAAQKDRLEKEEPEDLSDASDAMSAFDSHPGKKGWVAEVHKLLSKDELDSHWKKLVHGLQRTHFLGNTLAFMAGKNTAVASADPVTFSSLLPQLRKLATTTWEIKPGESQLHAALEAIHVLNGPTGGLFAQIHRALEKTGAARNFGDLLQPHSRISGDPLSAFTEYRPLVPNVITGYLRRNMTQGIRNVATNTPEFWSLLKKGDAETYDGLFRAVLESIQDVTGSALEQGTEGAANFNMPIYLNALALSEWLLYIEQKNEAKGRISRREFSNKLWESEVKLSEGHTVVFTDAEGVFLPEVREKLRRALAGQPEAEIDAAIVAWEKALQVRRAGEWKIEFASFVGISPHAGVWKDAVREAVVTCDKRLPFADLSAAIRIGLFYATEPVQKTSVKGPLLSPLQRLDGDNLLLRVNECLASLPAEAVNVLTALSAGGTDFAQMVHQFRDVIEKEEIAEPPKNEAEAKAREEMVARRAAIFDALETLGGVITSINEAAEKEKEKEKSKAKNKVFDGGKALTAYLNWLKALGSESLPAVGEILSIVKGSGLLQADFSTGQAVFTKYPALAERILGTETIAPTLGGFGYWDITEIFELERGVRLSFTTTQEPVSLYMEWLRGLAPRKTEAWDMPVEMLGTSSGAISDQEKLWIQRFVREGGLHRTWAFFGSNTSWGQSTGVIKELIKLVEQGSLGGALDLLGQIRDDRIKRIARVMKKWYHTGQLLEFLKACEKLVPNSPGQK